MIVPITICAIPITRHGGNVPDSKWRLLSNVLALVGKTGETVGLFQGAKCDNVPKRLVSPFHILLQLPVSSAFNA